MDVYTLGRYAWEDAVFSYEVFRCLGDHTWSGGVSGSKALCGFKELYDWFFALTMFGIGAVLQIEELKRIVQKSL